MASSIPKYLKKALTDVWATETLYVALFNSSWTMPTDGKYSTTNEIAGTGYTAGGIELSAKTSSYVDTVNSVLDATNTAFTSVLLTGANAPRYAIVYETATDLIRGAFDLGGNRTVTPTGNLTILWNGDGVIKVI